MSRPKSALFFLALLQIALCLPSAPARALPLARLRRLSPTVQTKRASAPRWIVARERGALTYGDTIRTSAKGKADVLFANGTQIALRGGTSIQISVPSKPSDPLVIRLFGALSEVFVRPKGNTQIRTAAAIAAARGTQYLVRLTDEKTTEVVVTEGSVDFSNERGAVVIEANQRSVAQVGSAPTVPITVDISGELRWTADVTQLPLESETPFRFLSRKNARRQLGIAQSEVARSPKNVALGLRLGEAFFDSFEYSMASQQFARVLQTEPQNVRALLGLSRAQRARGDGDAALDAAQNALEIAPDDASAKLDVALSQLIRGEEKPARATLESVANGSESSTRSSARSALGLMLLRSGRALEAEREFRAALATAPDSSQSRAFLALSLLTQNRLVEAENEARKSARSAPFSSQAQGVLSVALFFRGRLDEAESAAARAIALNPDSPFALLAQGRVALAQNRIDDAHDALARAQSLAPQFPIVAVELGEVYAKLQNWPKAEQNFRLALKQNPDLAGGHSGLGRVLDARGQSDEAARELERAVSLSPDDASIRARLVAFRIARGELEAAQSAIPKSLARTPENALLLARLSELHLFRQDLATAQDFARRAVILLPNSSVAHYQLGRVYLEQNRTFQALQQFRQAVVLDRDNAQARFALGTLREQIESARDFSRASSLILEANLGGALRGLNIQNLQTPGVEDRIQAALQNPTVARIATRSYGDTQIDGFVGTNYTQYADFSTLRESPDKRTLVGVSGFHDKRGGANPNSDQTTDRIGVTLGTKAKTNPSGLYFSGHWEHVNQGLNTDNFTDFSADARNHIDKPELLFGGNWQTNADWSTRFLFAWNQLDAKATELARDSRQSENARSLNFELRHDRQLDARNYLSFGLGSGQVRRNTNFFFGAFPPFVPDQRFLLNTRIRSTNTYLRDELSVSKRLTLTGEVQIKQLKLNTSVQFLEPDILPVSSFDIVNRNFLLPKVVLDYRPDVDTSFRLRVRRSLGAVNDFDLLKPTDLFSPPIPGLPQLGTGSLGTVAEFEAEHTFSDSSFLRINLFQQKLKNAQEPSADQSSGEIVPRARLRGLRASYEGSLGRDTTFFVNATWNDARDQTRDRAISFVPRFIGEAGLQLMRRDGWFLQPSFVYQSARFAPSASELHRQERPGFGLFNVRVGKRSGLKSAFFFDVANVLDREFDVLGVQQPGRQFRIGASQRF